MSSLDRQLGCPGFATVSTSEDKKSFNSRLSTIYGSSLHAYKEGKEWCLPLLPEADPKEKKQASLLLELQASVEEDKKYLPWLRERYAGFHHEVHLGYRLSDHKTFRWPDDETKLREVEAPDHATTLTGCCDGLMFDEETHRVHVNDLKSSEHPVALDEPQLLGYGLWAVTWAIQNLFFDPKRLTLSLSVLHWPRCGQYRDDYMEEYGRPASWYARDVPMEELRLFRDSLIEIYPKALRGHLEPGSHCVYCPGVLSCPALGPTRKR